MSITMTTVILFAVFGVLLFLGVPISISIVASSIVTAMSTLSWDQITFITMQKMNSGVESFSLLAVPLFILAGNIMNNGGIAKRLVNFAQLFVGKIPGSMAQANILGNMLFGALSGSSVAAASAMGGCISPIEEENGYDPAYSAAANIASAPTGLLIPPTSAFIVYSTVAGGVSISTLFMAGYIPGILMGLCCMVVAFIGAKRAGMKATGIDHSQSITLDDKAFRFWNVKANRWEIEGGEYELLVGASVEDIRLCEKISVHGTATVHPYEDVDLDCYYKGDVLHVSDADFEKLLGHPIPNGKTKIDRNLTLGELNHARSPLGWLVWLVLTILLDVSYKRGKPDLNILFQYNMPLRALAKMTNGAISMGMVDGIVMELQGFWILGLVRVIYEAIKNVVLNAQMEKRLRGA